MSKRVPPYIPLPANLRYHTTSYFRCGFCSSVHDTNDILQVLQFICNFCRDLYELWLDGAVLGPVSLFAACIICRWCTLAV